MNGQPSSNASVLQLPSALDVSKAMHFARSKKLRGCARKLADGEWVRICNGVYLEAWLLSGQPIWSQRRIVGIARAFGVARTGDRILLGLSSVLIYGLPLLNVPKDVVVHQRFKSGKLTVLPPVQVNQTLIMPAGQMCRRKRFAENLLQQRKIEDGDGVYSIVQESLPGALLTIACSADPEQAFVALCMGLHWASPSNHVRTADEAHKVEDARGILLAELDALPPMTHGVRRARLLVQEADGGCDSPGEARVLWVLKCAGVQGIRTQHIVNTEEGNFFVDIAIPSVKLAIEFDGFSKYDTSPLVHQQWGQQNRREQAIARQGYLVHRFQWENFNNPARMLTDLSVKLAHRGQGLPIQPTPFTRMFGIHAATERNNSQRSHSSWS